MYYLQEVHQQNILILNREMIFYVLFINTFSTITSLVMGILHNGLENLRQETFKKCFSLFSMADGSMIYQEKKGNAWSPKSC